MKRCTYCAEDIQDDAIKCRFCGEMLNGAHHHDTLKIYLALALALIVALIIVGILALFTSTSSLKDTTASLRPDSSSTAIAGLKEPGPIEAKSVSVAGLTLPRACADTKTSTYDVMVCNDNGHLNTSEGEAIESFLTRAAERDMTQKKVDQHYKNFLKRRSEACPINPFKDLNQADSDKLRECLIEHYKTL